MIVATQSSSEKSKVAADFVGDGVGDQEEIYAAIHALPSSGGTVTLMEGTYDIRKVKDKLGGLIIDRSNVTLNATAMSNGKVPQQHRRHKS